MKTEIDIPDRRLLGILDSAFHQSCRWITGVTPVQEGGCGLPFAAYVMGGGAVLVDHEDPELGGLPRRETRLDLAALAQGLTAMAVHIPHHLADLVNDQADAATGDYLIQCALFGSVVFE